MKKIYLVDANSFIYRMFFALPEFSTKDWEIVNALFGMAKFFTWQLIKENPDYLVFIKDAAWENFRHKIYSDYKATRDKMPDNLKTQISLIEEMVRRMWIDIIEIPWYEADDVIWTLAHNLWQDLENDVYILSWDKDLYSLTKQNVSIYDTMKKHIYNGEKSKEKFWIEPKYIIDYLAIVWDKSDNIPGVAWFGPKKAVDLINTYGTVENIYEHIGDEDFIIWWKTLEKLRDEKENAFLSKKLATIDLWVKFEFKLDDYKFFKDNIINNDIIDFFKKYEFNSLLWEDHREELKTWDDTWMKVLQVTSKKDLDNLLNKIKNTSEIVIDTETTGLNPHYDELVWISLFIDQDNIFYINVLHEGEKIDIRDVQEFLEELLSLDILIIWHNLKYDLEIIKNFLKSSQANMPDSWQKSLF